MWPFQNLLKPIRVVAVLLLATSTVLAQRKNPEIPGAVQLDNALILFGLCDNANSVNANTLQNRKLELRRINQQFRTYFVSTRRSVAPRPNDLALPKEDFRIIQRRVRQRLLNYELGLHKRDPFDTDGRSTVTLKIAPNKNVEIKIGVTAINSNRLQVDGLTHQWRFGVSIDAIPDDLLYNGAAAPGLLKNVREFNKGETQLNLVQMLLQAGKFRAAQSLLSDVENAFPDLEGRCERMTEAWNNRVGNRALEELAVLRDSGKFRTARGYARQWPEQKLAPIVRLRAKTFLEDLNENHQRLEFAKQALSELVANVEDVNLRREANELCTELLRELDLNTLERIDAFELLQLDEALTPEAKLALAATGMMLGAEAAIDNFSEAFGLLQIRFLLQDYVSTTDDESTTRNNLIEQIRRQEGFSIERIALLLQNLPIALPISVDGEDPASPGSFTVESEEDVAGCAGRVPAEYSPNRQYPLIIAFPREGLSTSDTLDWWQQTADRNGYIVVAPELYEETESSYDASAIQHQRFLNLIRTLKGGLSIDDDRVFVAGHGIGGEAAMDIATAHPDLFAGVVSIAGLARKHILRTAHNSGDLAWYVVVGSLHRDWSRRLEPVMEKLFKRHEVRDRIQISDCLFVRYDDRGYESFSEERANLFRWLNLQRRKNLPDRIHASVLRSTDQNWFWLNLGSIPDRFRSLDEPSTWEDSPGSDVKVSAEINGNGNLIRLRSLPADVTLCLSPGLPEIDLTKPITIVNVSGRKQKIVYAPATRDLLDDFRKNRDRKRLCYMKVPITK